MSDREMKEVYHISDREGQKAIWTRIGVAFVNKDDSLNILLDSIPLDGKLHVRKKSPRPIPSQSSTKGVYHE